MVALPSHYLILLRVPNDQARSFYEIEAAREGWSVRELERQIGSLLFERLSMNRDKEQVLALARRGQEVAVHDRPVHVSVGPEATRQLVSMGRGPSGRLVPQVVGLDFFRNE